MKRPEILAPAGDMTCLQAALQNGADAVYLGLDTLNMRVRSGINFTARTLPAACRRAHAAGAKVYLTLNSIVFDSELSEMRRMVRASAKHVDAFIVSDFAVMLACKEYGAPFHVSTQMSCSNTEAAKFFKSFGAERVVLARECALDEVRRICRRAGVEVETFVHGAQCVAESGRCFLSHHAYGKSACRGECRQPCRRQFLVQAVDRYTGSPIMPDGTKAPSFEVGPHTVMSAKDLCSLPYVQQLLKAGITSWKIEGRARNPEYVAATVSAYREARDAAMKGVYTKAMCDSLVERVSRVFHREFAFGLFNGRPGKDQFTDFEDSIASTVKRQLGIVRNYYAKSGVVEVLVRDRRLKVGDTVQIQGPSTGVVELVVPSLRRDAEELSAAAKGTWATFKCPRVRIGDKVFLVESRPMPS